MLRQRIPFPAQRIVIAQFIGHIFIYAGYIPTDSGNIFRLRSDPGYQGSTHHHMEAVSSSVAADTDSASEDTLRLMTAAMIMTRKNPEPINDAI